jgi:DnaJ-class molecular chaperone
MTDKTKECEYCSGYGKVNVFLAEDDEQVVICPICKGTGKSNKPSPTGNIPLWIGQR